MSDRLLSAFTSTTQIQSQESEEMKRLIKQEDIDNAINDGHPKVKKLLEK